MEENIAKEAFEQIWPGDTDKFEFSVKYSDHFEAYNANIRKANNIITICMSRKWYTIDSEIKKGLIQVLLVKILKRKASTKNMELYEKFIKNLHIGIPKVVIDPLLEISFDRVNDEYFYGLIDKPNLVWGVDSKTKLGSYNYHTDTIMMSKVFYSAYTADAKNRDLIDYVMYHEMLHKKHKFKTKNGKSFHHTHEFRKREQEFKDAADVENRLKIFLRKQKGLFGLKFF